MIANYYLARVPRIINFRLLVLSALIANLLNSDTPQRVFRSKHFIREQSLILRQVSRYFLATHDQETLNFVLNSPTIESLVGFFVCFTPT